MGSREAIAEFWDRIAKQPQHEITMASIEQALRGINLYLIGMMGSGKTTIGKLLAERIGYRFFDTDATIESVAGQSIPEIFAESGESGFRDLESQVLAELSAYGHLAIATGGGIVLRRTNWSRLHYGLTVWLDVPVGQLYQRLQSESENRPLLQTADPQGRLQELLEQRRSLYAQADLCIAVKADETPTQVVDKILATIPSVLKPTPTPTGDRN